METRRITVKITAPGNVYVKCTPHAAPNLFFYIENTRTVNTRTKSPFRDAVPLYGGNFVLEIIVRCTIRYTLLL